MASSTGKGKAIFRVVSGNFLEMFDFMVFGFYATAIAKTFFPSDSAFASLMLALATFGAGFLMRPLGAIFLGAYIEVPTIATRSPGCNSSCRPDNTTTDSGPSS